MWSLSPGNDSSDLTRQGRHSRLNIARTVLAHCMSMQHGHAVSPPAGRPQQLCPPNASQPSPLIGIVASRSILPILSHRQNSNGPSSQHGTTQVMEIPVLHKGAPRRRATSVGESWAPPMHLRTSYWESLHLKGPTRTIMLRSEAGSRLPMADEKQGRRGDDPRVDKPRPGPLLELGPCAVKPSPRNEFANARPCP